MYTYVSDKGDTFTYSNRDFSYHWLRYTISEFRDFVDWRQIIQESKGHGNKMLHDFSDAQPLIVLKDAVQVVFHLVSKFVRFECTFNYWEAVDCPFITLIWMKLTIKYSCGHCFLLAINPLIYTDDFGSRVLSSHKKFINFIISQV